MLEIILMTLLDKIKLHGFLIKVKNYACIQKLCMYT